MRHLTVDVSTCRTKDDLYLSFLVALRVPDWHGHNLDALWDSITSDVNGVMPPYVIEVSGSAALSEDAAALLERFEAMFADAHAERQLQVSIRRV
jgi:RNAse (barnase) inhibitor barstar